MSSSIHSTPRDRGTSAHSSSLRQWLHHGPLKKLYRRLFNVLGFKHRRLLLGYGTHARIRHAWMPTGGKLAIHRYYTDCFLAAHASDIRGHCMEFQEDSYATRFGGGRLDKLDILHVDETSEHATLIADLTKPNQIPDDTFDCIICTFVLQCVWDYQAAVRDMRRILRPGGVLLGCVPLVMGYTANCGEWCRFSPEALDRIMGDVFEAGDYSLQSYGNSLTAMADVRGLAAEKFSQRELDFHDPNYPVLLTFRAVKPPRP